MIPPLMCCDVRNFSGYLAHLRPPDHSGFCVQHLAGASRESQEERSSFAAVAAGLRAMVQ